MNAYSISDVARDAGVSVHVVRDYLLRGLLHPAQRTASGYNIFDASTLERLRFLRTSFESGIGLDELRRLCRALDAEDCREVITNVERLCKKIDAQRKDLTDIENSLATMARNALRHSSHGVHAVPGSMDDVAALQA